jgi:hypothetical protein
MVTVYYYLHRKLKKLRKTSFDLESCLSPEEIKNRLDQSTEINNTFDALLYGTDPIDPLFTVNKVDCLKRSLKIFKDNVLILSEKQVARSKKTQQLMEMLNLETTDFQLLKVYNEVISVTDSFFSNKNNKD